jgi:ligand-binding sensor protein
MTKNSPVPPNSDEVSHGAPAGWAEVQEKLASVAGVSVLLVNGPQPPELLASNNNSICRTFQSSPHHVTLCDPYCGDAHRRAMEAGSTTQYRCHAGLECFTQPIQIGKRKKLAVIGGRAFFNAADYHDLVERFRTGDLKSLLPNQPFANVIFSDEQKLEQLAVRLDKSARNFSGKEAAEPASTEVAATPEPTPAPSDSASEFAPEPELIAKITEELADKAELARLKSELEYRTRLTESLQSFSERISSADPKETYNSILTTASELLQAERSSLLVCNDVSIELVI